MRKGPMYKPLIALLAVIGALLVAGCQSDQPHYQAASLPLPPEPTTPAKLDLSAYPAAPVDFGKVRTWAWADSQQALPADLKEAVQSGLDQHGLRPALKGPADLKVRVSVQLQTHYKSIYPTTSIGYGYYPGHWHHHHYHHHYYSGFGLGADYPLIESYQPVQVQMLGLQFQDAQGHRLWSGQTQLPSGSGAANRKGLFKAVNRALKGYPPS